VAPKRKPRRTAAETREQILTVAAQLFYWNGIRAVGVDRIAADAQVAPPTLYRLFGSKDALVAAYVRRNDEGYRAWFLEATAPRHGAARARILALFEALIEQVQPDRCRGCPYLMALAEHPDRESEVHGLAVATKVWVRTQLRTLVAELGSVTDPDLLADQLALLMEGVYASVQALGVDGPARRAVPTATILLDAAAAAENRTPERAPVDRAPR
jgi:AcrR family transcriptional regulator